MSVMKVRSNDCTLANRYLEPMIPLPKARLVCRFHLLPPTLLLARVPQLQFERIDRKAFMTAPSQPLHVAHRKFNRGPESVGRAWTPFLDLT